jgi:hypothetical protein
MLGNGGGGSAEVEGCYEGDFWWGWGIWAEVPRPVAVVTFAGSALSHGRPAV